jgi:hypothetical protein
MQGLFMLSVARLQLMDVLLKASNETDEHSSSAGETLTGFPARFADHGFHFSNDRRCSVEV